MKIREAFEAQERDRDTPVPINAGRCEAVVYANHAPIACGARGRWLVRGQFRCGKHKDSFR